MTYHGTARGIKLTVAVARKRFSYNPETGELFRNLIDGVERTGYNLKGYNVVTHRYRVYRVTYIIWLIMHGRPPNGADGNSRNDKFENLREATQSQNGANSRLPKRNRSGVKGVAWNKRRSKWIARIGFNYKTIEIGRFNTMEEAKAAYNTKAKELFGEFARS